jgi:hypothetical protein
MKRLRDQRESSDPTVAFGASLLAPVKHLEPSLAMKRRVRVALANRGRRRALRVVRVAVVFALTIGFGAIAVAAFDGGWTGLGVFGKATPSREGSSGPIRRQLEPTPIATPPSESLPSPIAAPAVEAEHEQALRPLPRVRRTLEPRKESAALRPTIVEQTSAVLNTPSNDASDSGVELVIRGLSILRRDHDPERAAALFDAYLERHPSGELVEEALALAIEAAVQRNDGRAASLAARYLECFPTGRFRGAAERAQKRQAE